MKTKNTAARLDRFEKPDRWPQRRVEDGFAVNAACAAENNRAIFDNIDKAMVHACKGKLHSMTMNDEPFEITADGGVAYRPEFIGRENSTYNLKRAIMKDLEPMLLPCLDFLARAIDEFKDAFSFLWYVPKHWGVINNFDTSEWQEGTDLYLDPNRPGELVTYPTVMESWTRGRNVSGRKLEAGEVVQVVGTEVIDGQGRFLFDACPGDLPHVVIDPIAKDKPGWALNKKETERINKP